MGECGKVTEETRSAGATARAVLNSRTSLRDFSESCAEKFARSEYLQSTGDKTDTPSVISFEGCTMTCSLSLIPLSISASNAVRCPTST